MVRQREAREFFGDLQIFYGHEVEGASGLIDDEPDDSVSSVGILKLDPEPVHRVVRIEAHD